MCCWCLASVAAALLLPAAARAPARTSVPDGAGIGPARVLAPRGEHAAGGRSARLRCAAGSRATARAAAVHLELFAHGHVVIVPAGIGLARRCRYPVWTAEPTGLIRVERGDLTLGDLFAVWGQALSARRMARWRGPLRVAVNGRPSRRHPAAIGLRPHDQIVVQVGRPYVEPHAAYFFPAGL